MPLINSLSGQLGELSKSSQLGSEARKLVALILRLIPSFGETSSFDAGFRAICERAIETSEGKSDHKEEWMTQGIWNDAHSLAEILKCSMPSPDWAVSHESLLQLAGRRYWNREVMAAIADCLQGADNIDLSVYPLGMS